ncbi:matrixin family metalloprotease [Vibrio sp. EA2]|uniref:matrixin family metalloprotease n=1 Tax=Vibrio sp. EA2 TaxID=3079860 RepID=UPI00294A7C39|nr:matrixin family metalloprotease [Vibrio sp. EA2]MDV6251946.1 matrixin family metalloprotease [Vibrio sp. EA2]
MVSGKKAPRDDAVTPKSAGAEFGSFGDNVERLNKYLGKFGYFDNGIHARYGMSAKDAVAPPPNEMEFSEQTEHALRKFQEFNGLVPTGKLDQATLDKMSHKRCGYIEGGEYNDSGRKWNSNNLTYAFREFTGDLTPAEIRTAISAAFGYWAAVTPLSFQEVAMSASPDIIIRFVTGDHGDGSPFDGGGGVLAHAFYPEQGAISGDSHFDDAETWSIDLPASNIDLYTVAAHEFGHALGLGHSSVSGALMAPYYGGPHRYLHQDDIDGIQSIYGVQQWANNKQLLKVFTSYHGKNAWAYIQDVGWRKIKPATPEGVTSMFYAACEARANGMTVNALTTASEIEQLYV